MEKLLKDHPLYGLNRAIADYLEPVLEKRFGGRFLDYRRQEEGRTAATVEETRALGATLTGQELFLQEELLAGPGPDDALRQAWQALLEVATGQWGELCQLYADVQAELRDLAAMAAAQEAAARQGDDAHAARVAGILALDGAVAPTWLR